MKVGNAHKIINFSDIKTWERHVTISQNHLRRFPDLDVQPILRPPGKLPERNDRQVS